MPDLISLWATDSGMMGCMSSPEDAIPSDDPTVPVPTLTVSVQQRDSGAVVLRIAGEVDLVTAPQLDESITHVLEERPKVLVVDLTEVGFLASAGMSILVAAHNTAGEQTRMRLVASGSATFRPMELTGLAETMAIFPTLHEALDGA